MSRYEARSCLYSDESEEEEDDDDYWKSKGQNKFSTAIFSDSDKEDEKPVKQDNAKLTKETEIRLVSGDESARLPVRKVVQSEQAPKSIGMSYLQSNPISSRGISTNNCNLFCNILLIIVNF